MHEENILYLVLRDIQSLHEREIRYLRDIFKLILTQINVS